MDTTNYFANPIHDNIKLIIFFQHVFNWLLKHKFQIEMTNLDFQHSTSFTIVIYGKDF